jgi:hypothetical protein
MWAREIGARLRVPAQRSGSRGSELAGVVPFDSQIYGNMSGFAKEWAGLQDLPSECLRPFIYAGPL